MDSGERKRPSAWLRRAVLIGCGLAAGACAPARRECLTLVPEPPVKDSEVQVVFLGVGGVLVRWQGSALMTAPLYSNPTIGELALSEIHPDRQRIRALIGVHEVASVRAILVGHSHYDHLMDVPYIALHEARQAAIIGNDATVKLLAPIASELRPRAVISLESPNPDELKVEGTRFRVKAILSEHSPQIGAKLFHGLIDMQDVILWRGEDEHPARELPVRAGSWPSGTTLAYVIELLEPDRDDVAFRIYYQDSPTRPAYGYPEPGTSNHPYNLAILCVGGAVAYESFPGDIVRHLQPAFAMGIHWEDFLDPRPLPTPSPAARSVREKLGYLPGVSQSRFLREVRRAQPAGGRATMPCPDDATTFRRTNGRWEIAQGSDAWAGAATR